MTRQIYEQIGYPRQTISTFGNTHTSSVSSLGGTSVVGTPIGTSVIGNPIGSQIGTPIGVSTIGDTVVSPYGVQPYGLNNYGGIGGPVVTSYGGGLGGFGNNIVKKTTVTETFINQG